VAEQIAINAENIIYRSDYSEPVRVGHSHATKGKHENAAVAAFAAVSGAPEMINETIDGDLATTFKKGSEEEYVKKTIYSNNSASPAMRTAQLNNYITIEAHQTGEVIALSGEFTELANIVATQDGASSRAQDKISAGVDRLSALTTSLAATANMASTPSYINSLIENLPTYDQTNIKVLSAEVATRDNSAGVKAGPSLAPAEDGAPYTAPGFLPIAASSEGTVIVGAAGYRHESGVGQYDVDFSQRVDDLLGSGEADFLVGGDSSNSSSVGTLAGGGGNDIVVGGTGKNVLNGDAGDDLLVMGEGGGTAIGGGGTDVLSFLDDSTAVNVDLSIADGNGLFTASQGGVETKVGLVEMVQGTSGADTLIGGGKGYLLSGGAGNDSITLSRGDIAIGGAGADSFYLSTKAPDGTEDIQSYLQSNKVSILDFNNAEDKIYINGKLFDGNQKVGTIQLKSPHEHAGNILYDYAVTLTGTSSYEVNYPDVQSFGGNTTYLPTAVRDARISKGQDEFSGMDQLQFAAFDYDPNVESVDYNELLYVDIPSLSPGNITFTSSGVTDGQIRLAAADPETSPAWLSYTQNGIDLGYIGSDTDVPVRYLYENALQYGSLEGAESTGDQFYSDDFLDINEEVFANNEEPEVEDPETPDSEAGSIGIPPVGTPDKIVVYGNTLSSPTVNVLSNDNASATSISLVDGNFLQLDTNLELDRWYGTFTISPEGDAVATVDSGAVSAYSLSPGYLLDRLTYGALGVFSYVDVVYGGDALSGTSGNDTLTGTADDDYIDGLAGDDTLIGGTGDDLLFGGADDDHYTINLGDGADTISDSAGTDTLEFGVGIAPSDVLVAKSEDENDYILAIKGQSQWITLSGAAAGGSSEIESVVFSNSTVWTTSTLESLATGTPTAGAIVVGTGDADELAASDDEDVVFGGYGNDSLSATYADNYLAGGLGDDIYAVSQSSTVVVEKSYEGSDEIQTTLSSYSLPDNVEKLTFLDSANATGTGNALSNLITGNVGDDSLDGGAGNDTLDGGVGADTLIGGLGNDQFLVDDSGDSVVENASEGTDDVRTTLASYTLGSNLENLSFNGAGSFTGTGNALDNRITGGAGDDSLDGGSGNDRLDGGEGADTLVGGSGDDLFLVDGSGDVVVEGSSSGTDTVFASTSYTLGANVENLTYIGAGNFTGTGNGLDNTITGGIGDDFLDGAGGADSLIGGYGDDSYVIDDAGDVVDEAGGGGWDDVETTLTSYTLGDDIEGLFYTGSSAFAGTGNSLDNWIGGAENDDTLVGADGNDTLEGDGGNNTLIGGAGDDTYITVGSDTITEAADSGTDTVVVDSNVLSSFTLSDPNLENLTFTGDAGGSGIGNSLDNVLTGSDGADTLDGGGGADTLIGGYGDDTYVVDEGGVTVVEDADGDFYDTVSTSLNSYTLGTGLEIVEFTGTGDFTGTGNSADNELYGADGADTLSGGDGNDWLDGGAGSDLLTGGTGDDGYYVDDAGDVVVEASNEGYDEVDTSLSSYTLTSNIEVLWYDGSGDFTGTGNALDNEIYGDNGNDTLSGEDGNDWIDGGNGDNLLEGGIGSDTLSGGSGSDSLIGGDGNDSLDAGSGDNVLDGGNGDDQLVSQGGNDSLEGGAGNDDLTAGSGADSLFGGDGADTLAGGDGNDVLDGGTGADMMSGGTGNDIYYVDSSDDQVNEYSGEGTDQVLVSSNTYSLGSNLESASFVGSGNASIQGNSGSNSIATGDGNDSLSGGGGNDTLNGGDGDDSYTFQYNGSSNVYTIEDSDGFDTLTINGINPANVSVSVSGDGHDYLLSMSGKATSSPSKTALRPLRLRSTRSSLGTTAPFGMLRS